MEISFWQRLLIFFGKTFYISLNYEGNVESSWSWGYRDILLAKIIPGKGWNRLNILWEVANSNIVDEG